MPQRTKRSSRKESKNAKPMIAAKELITRNADCQTREDELDQ